MERPWQFAGSATEGDGFEIKGAKVWGRGWQVQPGEEAHVHDPVYGRSYLFKVFSIQEGEERIEFAAGEFSRGEWGFFTRE